MGLFNGGWKGNILGGLAIGIGSAVLAPVVIPILSRTAKPLTKAAIKGALLMYEKGKEKVAEAQEVVEDSWRRPVPSWTKRPRPALRRRRVPEPEE